MRLDMRALKTDSKNAEVTRSFIQVVVLILTIENSRDGRSLGPTDELVNSLYA